MVEHIARKWIELHGFGVLEEPDKRKPDRVEVHFVPSGRPARGFLERHQRPGEEPPDTFIRSGQKVVEMLGENGNAVVAYRPPEKTQSQAAALMFMRKPRS